MFYVYYVLSYVPVLSSFLLPAQSHYMKKKSRCQVDSCALGMYYTLETLFLMTHLN